MQYVKAKPSGDGFVGVPLRELHMELSKSLREGQWNLSANGQWMSGLSGQTLETIAIDTAIATKRRVGVPAISYAMLGMRYNFDR